MQKKLSSLLCLALVGIMATSCSTYDNVAVWYKYRNDFRAHPVATDRLAVKSNATATPSSSVAAVTTDDQAPILEASANVLLASANEMPKDIAVSSPAAEGKALAAALTAKSFASAPEAAISVASPKPEKLTIRQAFKLKKELKQAAAPQAGGRSQVVAIVLAFFLGVLGIHRFYLGYTWQGVVQLLTAGGFGIWFLIDLVRIIIGDLKPKGGDYN